MTTLGDAPSLAWERLLEAGEIDDRLVTTSLDSARPARTVAAPGTLAPELSAALARAGIGQLYSHQVEALSAARKQP